MIFYTAGPFDDRPFVREVAQKIRDAGWQVNSRWLDVDPGPDAGPERDIYMQEMAKTDLEDVLRAEALIYVNTGRMSEGKATELGICIATMKPIIVIGDRSNNVFLNLNFPVFSAIDDAIVWMKEQEAAWQAQQTS